MSETLIILKADALERGLVGKIISRFEEKGLSIEHICTKVGSKNMWEEHYAEHREKPFFSDLVVSMTDKKVICISLRGPNDHTIDLVRAMVGESEPLKRLPGTIRFDFSCERRKNVIHASDSKAAFEHEKLIWL